MIDRILRWIERRGGPLGRWAGELRFRRACDTVRGCLAAFGYPHAATLTDEQLLDNIALAIPVLKRAAKATMVSSAEAADALVALLRRQGRASRERLDRAVIIDEAADMPPDVIERAEEAFRTRDP